MEFTEGLERKFKNLGFWNVKEFSFSADPLLNYPTKENPLRDVHILDDLYSDHENIGFIFIVAKDSRIDDWYIESISASVRLDTKRNKEGVLVINKTYKHSNGQLPRKEAIRKEILESIAIEKAKDLTHSIQQLKQQVNGFSVRR